MEWSDPWPVVVPGFLAVLLIVVACETLIVWGRAAAFSGTEPDRSDDD